MSNITTATKIKTLSRSYSKNSNNKDLRIETSCPRPSETVKPALVAVDGGIL